MFIHNFKYSIKTLFGNKMLIFWTFAFPIVLGTFFNLAFSNIENSEKLEMINIAIVEDDNFQLEENRNIKESFKTLSDEENEERLFNTQYVSEERAKELLEKDEISGYLKIEDNKPKVIIKTNGMNETVLKYVTEEIMQTTKVVEDLIEQEVTTKIASGNMQIDYEKLYQEVLEIAQQEDVKLNDISNANLSYTMIEYYTLIAMTCLYGGILGMTAINSNLANMGEIGKRTSIAPISKGKIILSSLLASYITQLVGLAILFIYTIFVLKVDYGSNLPQIILLSFVGSLAGLSLGIAVATLIKSNENTKTGILIAITMLGCFLSGMMGITMKYIIDKNIPIINKINPASMITDGFYSLYYYDTFDRYNLNIKSLLIFSAIMILISIRGLRRQKYDSI